MGIIYLLWNLPYFWKLKIGITTVGKAKKRVKSITKSTPGVAIPVFFMIMPFGTLGLEQTLHQLFRGLKSPFKKGSGRTEWFLVIVYPVAVILITITAALYWAPIVFVVWKAFG